jgi:hypothetical protein
MSRGVATVTAILCVGSRTKTEAVVYQGFPDFVVRFSLTAERPDFIV